MKYLIKHFHKKFNACGSFISISWVKMYYYFHNQNISFLEQGRVLEKSCTFVQWGYQALHCVDAVFLPVFQCHAVKRHRPVDKKCNFCSYTGFNKFPDFLVQWWVWTMIKTLKKVSDGNLLFGEGGGGECRLTDWHTYTLGNHSDSININKNGMCTSPFSWRGNCITFIRALLLPPSIHRTM